MYFVEVQMLVAVVNLQVGLGMAWVDWVTLREESLKVVSVNL